MCIYRELQHDLDSVSEILSTYINSCAHNSVHNSTISQNCSSVKHLHSHIKIKFNVNPMDSHIYVQRARADLNDKAQEARSCSSITKPALAAAVDKQSLTSSSRSSTSSFFSRIFSRSEKSETKGYTSI
jgi:hypothetical protein